MRVDAERAGGVDAGGERFPMQSVFKLPVALHVLHEVDAGRVKLEAKITLGPAAGRAGARHMAVAVFIAKSRQPLDVREAIIARIARAAYDYWTGSTRKREP